MGIRDYVDNAAQGVQDLARSFDLSDRVIVLAKTPTGHRARLYRDKGEPPMDVERTCFPSALRALADEMAEEGL